MNRNRINSAARPHWNLRRAGFAALLFALGQTALAEQRLDMEGTAIFGNQESPNILYVVPWQGSDRIAPLEPPRIGQADHIMLPLDREVFRRRVEWHNTFGEKL